MKILAASIGLLAVAAAPALAADLPARPYTKAPIMAPVSIANWSGFYVGINGGYGSDRANWFFTGPGVAGDEGGHTATGGVIGGQVGYNWQSSNWVFGLEAQGDWASLRGSNLSTRFAGITNRTRVNALGLFTGRVGYAWDNVLLYAKGGAMVVDDRYSFLNGAGTVLSTGSESRWGGAIGAGLEVAMSQNWTVGVEYMHGFLGTKNIGFSPVIGNDDIRQNVDLFTARVNYKFGGPVVAKY